MAGGWLGKVADNAGTILGIGGGAASAVLSAREAKKQRKFQERMSRNSVRYRVEDLRRSGLNPILAASAGLGGGLPSGASASMPDLGRVGDTMNTARDVTTKRRRYEERERALLNSQTRKNQHEGNAAEALMNVRRAEATLLRTKIPGAMLEHDIDQTRYAKFMRYTGRALPVLNTAVGALGVLKLPKLLGGDSTKSGDQGRLNYDKSPTGGGPYPPRLTRKGTGKHGG